MTVGAQFGEHLARLGVPAAERRGRAEAALASVRFAAPARCLDRYPFQLSGGMCQRVLIAMAFASDPALLVADEPTTALDVSTQVHIVELLRALQADHGTAILFITHDLRLASRVCDDLLVLYAGEMVERGPAREVMARPRHPYTRSLKAANPSLDGPLRRLAALPDAMPGIAGLSRPPRLPLRAALPGGRSGLRARAAGARRPSAPATSCAARPDACTARRISTRRCCRQRPPSPASASRCSLVTAVSKRYPGRRDWLGRRGPGVDAVRAVDLAVRAGRVRRHRRRIGLRQVHPRPPRHGPGAAERRPHRRRRRRRDRERARDPLRPSRRAADGVPGPAIGAEPAPPDRPPRHPGDGGASQPRAAARAPRPRPRAPRRDRACRRAASTATRPSSPGASASGSTSPGRSASRRACSSPTRSSPASTCPSRRRSSTCCSTSGPSAASRLLLISHDLAVVRYLCSRVLVMQRRRGGGARPGRDGVRRAAAPLYEGASRRRPARRPRPALARAGEPRAIRRRRTPPDEHEETSRPCSKASRRR